MNAIIFNITFVGLMVGQTISILVGQYTEYTPREYFLLDSSLLGYFVYLISFLMYMYFFNLKVKRIKFSLDFFKKKYDFIFLVYISILLFYWIPVFLIRGVSGVDRVAYWMSNSDIYLQSMLYTMYFLSLAVVLARNSKSYRVFTALSLLFVVILCGERATGIILSIPVFMFTFRESLIGMAPYLLIKRLLLIFLLIFLFKFFTYYYFNSGIEGMLFRFTGTGGLMNSVMQNNEYFNFISSPGLLVPYQEWGLSDKSYLMTLFFTQEYLDMAESTKGLTGGSMVEGITFGLHWLVTPIISAIIGYIYGAFVFLSTRLLQSRIFLYQAIGFVFLFIFVKRLLGVVHSGFITDLFRIETVLVLVVALIVSVNNSSYLKLKER